MILSFVLNLLIAVTWALLKDDINAVNLVVGFFLGTLVLYLFSRVSGRRFYLEKVLAAVKMALVFFRELIKANIAVLLLVLRPDVSGIRPGIFALELDVKSDLEITLLADMITLTPGTLSVDVSPDKKYLYVHCIDIADVEEVRAGIKSTLEKAVLEVSR